MEEENTSNLSAPAPAEQKYNFSYNIPKKKSNKTTFVLVIILLMILSAIGFFFFRPTPPTSVPLPTASETPSPTPSVVPFVRPDFSFEVLNGSGTSGLAKKFALKLQDLGYQVIKTGNADKQTYAKTEILVRKDYTDKVDVIIADLKDAIKIASIAGELKEGTASARIILGKDSI